MGTHPIFESDFDCLTDKKKCLVESAIQMCYKREFRDQRDMIMLELKLIRVPVCRNIWPVLTKFKTIIGFKRIRISTFTQLILQVDQVNKMTDGGGDEGTPDEENTKPNINDKEHTTFLDVINGTGEISLKDDKIQAALPPKPKIEQLYTPYAQMPYLLVDVRDSDDYDQCHIITAHSYPAANFSRTMNPFSPEMHQYKNVEGKIIIIYDVDEFLATDCAHQMVQRGFENIFVLSGGLRLIAQKIPSGLTTGSFPAECFLSLDKRTQIKKFDKNNQYPADKRKRFSNENLADLSENLDALLVAPSDSGSRMSRISRPVKSVRSGQTTARSTNGAKPRVWK